MVCYSMVDSVAAAVVVNAVDAVAAVVVVVQPVVATLLYLDT